MKNILNILTFILINSFAYAQQTSPVVINEYSCANWMQFPDNFAEFEDWVELYNTSNTAVSLGGYHLSDDNNEPMKWTFPANSSIAANSHLIVWCSKRPANLAGTALHANFSLSQSKGNPDHIVFSNPAGDILEDINIDKTQKHQSWGRSTDGDTTWVVYTAPSPNVTNNDITNFIKFADKPDMDVEPGFYDSSIEVILSTTETNAEIRYTIDGTEPTATSPLYTNPITVATTTIIKAQTFSNDANILPSFVGFNTYFIGTNHVLPVVSISGEQLQDLANGNQPLRPQGTFEYFNRDKVRTTKAYGEFNSHGQDSWANDQRSLDWITRDQFGYNNALKDSTMIPFTTRKAYQRVILRASGDDNYPAANNAQNAGSAHIRDGYVQNLAKMDNLNLDVRTTDRIVVYIDGDYWGVYEIREIPDEHDYTEYYYNQGKYDLQYILTWGNTWAEYGDAQALDDWDNLYNYIKNNNMASPPNFQIIDNQYDWKSLCDYVIVNSVSVCSDWLNYNTGWWRGLNPEGGHRKWGYILWDNDATFGHYINYTGIPDTSPYADPCDADGITSQWSDPKGHIKTLNRLRQNPMVDNYYINRQIDLWNTTFSCEHMLSVLDEYLANIDPEMEQHANRWFGTYDGWKTNAAKLRNFIELRCTNMPDGLKECYDLTGPYDFSLSIEPAGVGNVDLNTMNISTFPYTGQYFGGIETALKANANANSGYEFDYWTDSNGQILTNADAPSITLDLNGANNIVAHFKEIDTPTSDLENDAATTLKAYPTLFDKSFTVDFQLAEAANVGLKLINTMGQEVYTITRPSTAFTAGNHTINIDATRLGLANGMYIVQMQVGKTQRNVKVFYGK